MTPVHEQAPGPVEHHNAYARGYDQRAVPDLDASVPVLRARDLPRLNRKALAFLGGLVALLMMAAAWMFRSAAARDGDAHAPRKETVVIPQLPAQAVASMPPLPLAAEPAAVAVIPSAPLPPLPEQMPAPTA